ncbi:chemotaxis protein CheB [Mycolicibacterium mengxianglii]|uniref:chemotaxis protein CheB n=1 Tax=Mycolicibacterium mengxianglii TaxID=2736649 RepID=UPI0038CBFCFC
MSVPADAPNGVVAVGASAGGVEALQRFAAGLPEDLPYAVLVVLHMPAGAASVLAKIMDRSGPLPAVTARDGEVLAAGRIHVGVPDRHLLVDDHHVVLSQGPTENGHRPAVNALFRSAALQFGPRAIGVLLSGALDDGVLGLAAIRACGGVAVVQDPADALFSGMPRNAIEGGEVDHQLPASDIGPLLAKLVDRVVEETGMEQNVTMQLENRIAMGSRFSTEIDGEALGPPSGYTCPDCNGSLMEVQVGNYRCRVGHAWSSEALLVAHDQEVEGALWVALRSLEEKAKLSRRLAANVGSGPLYQRYTELADEAGHAYRVLSTTLEGEYRTSAGAPGES